MGKFLVLLAIALSATSSNAVANCDYDGEVFATGEARDPRSGRLVYCEYHLPENGSERRVLYYSPAGHRIAEKELNGLNSTVPGVSQQDYRHGEERSVNPSGGQVQLRYRKSANSDWQIAHLPTAEVEVADAGFDKFVRDNWKQLAGGQTVSFTFASPLHGRSVRLRAQQVACRQPGNDSLCLQVDLAQPLLRMFAGDLYLVYQRPTRRLSLFEGVVNLLDDGADSQRLQIRYRY